MVKLIDISGVATSVVPTLVEIEGDVRSRNNEKLEAMREEIVSTICNAVEKYGAKVTAEVEHKYSSFLIDTNSTVVKLAKRAYRRRVLERGRLVQFCTYGFRYSSSSL